VADDLAGATTQRVMGVNNKGDKVNGVQSKGFLSEEVDFNLSDSTIEINEDVMVLVLEEDSIPGIYMLRYADTDDEYMCATKDAQCRLEKKIKEDLTLEDNTLFDVTSVFSGKVLEIKESPLYGKYVVLEHDNSLKTYYYGLSEVTVSVGATVNQGDKLGVSGTTEIDPESGVHVFLKVTKKDTHINPEKLIGKKISEI
jgi:stage II sporulation protein Q